jgi:hypothetical protein
MIAMELARVAPSTSTFFGVHSGLAMGSIYLCGSEEQKSAALDLAVRASPGAARAVLETGVQRSPGRANPRCVRGTSRSENCFGRSCRASNCAGPGSAEAALRPKIAAGASPRP